MMPPDTAPPDTKAFLFLPGTLLVTVERKPALRARVHLTATAKDHRKLWAHIECVTPQLAEHYFAALGPAEAMMWWQCFFPELPVPRR